MEADLNHNEFARYVTSQTRNESRVRTFSYELSGGVFNYFVEFFNWYALVRFYFCLTSWLIFREFKLFGFWNLQPSSDSEVVFRWKCFRLGRM